MRRQPDIILYAQPRIARRRVDIVVAAGLAALGAAILTGVIR